MLALRYMNFLVILSLFGIIRRVNSQFGLGNLINSALQLTRIINPDTIAQTLNIFSPGIAEELSPILKIVQENGLTSTYNVKTKPFPTRDVYDFIVIGAGTAGATVANRLSENENWNVLLVEAGGPETLINQIPILYAFPHQTDYNYGYRLVPQKNACFGMTDQLCTWPRGKSLGGTSTLNAMIHTRGNKLDYDLWAKMGNKGWSYDDVLPYFIKSEKFEATDLPFDSSFHGYDGNVCVQNIPYRTSLATAYLEAGKELGYKVLDYNGQEQIGFSYLQVNMDHGARCSSARAHLRINRPNLDIVPQTYVTKILIDEGKRAYGVEYAKHGKTWTVRASKEIISSAGTVDGAKLLMLSGIGPKDHLEQLGIEVIKDSKVGYNMYEHVATWGLLFTVDSNEPLTLSSFLNPVNALQYSISRDGVYSLPAGAESLAFIRTKLAPDERPDVELLLISGGIHSDGGLSIKPSYGISDEVYNQFFRPLENRYAFTVWPVVQHPKSVGRLTLKSKNPFDSPILDPNLFSNSTDLDIIVEGIKATINITKTAAFQKYNTKIYDRKLLGCESHEFGTDDYFKCVVKTLPVMENHEMGTAKMGPESDPEAVVDPELRVIGIKNLRVIDASIMPTMTVGHINAGVYMIGEKGSDMIKQTWQNK